MAKVKYTSTFNGGNFNVDHFEKVLKAKAKKVVNKKPASAKADSGK